MKTLVFVAWICGQDLASGAWDFDCGGYDERAASVLDCAGFAAWLTGTSPSGVRVMRWECFFDDGNRARRLQAIAGSGRAPTREGKP